MNINWEAWVALLTAIGSMLLAYQLHKSTQEQNFQLNKSTQEQSFLFKSHEHLVQLSRLVSESENRSKEHLQNTREFVSTAKDDALDRSKEATNRLHTLISEWMSDLEHAKYEIILYQFAMDEQEFAMLMEHIEKARSKFHKYKNSSTEIQAREALDAFLEENSSFWESMKKIITESAEKIARRIRL